MANTNNIAKGKSGEKRYELLRKEIIWFLQANGTSSLQQISLGLKFSSHALYGALHTSKKSQLARAFENLLRENVTEKVPILNGKYTHYQLTKVKKVPETPEKIDTKPPIVNESSKKKIFQKLQDLIAAIVEHNEGNFKEDFESLRQENDAIKLLNEDLKLKIEELKSSKTSRLMEKLFNFKDTSFKKD